MVATTSSSRLASHAFHTVAPLRFSREQHAVLSGQRAYYAQLDQARRSAPALRRNTHRLEKGLLMRPPRPVFALEYIGETLDFFDAAVGGFLLEESEIDVAELRWAADVLAAYFARTEGQKEVAEHHNRYKKIALSLSPSSLSPSSLSPSEASEPKVPYKRGSQPSPVTYDQMLALSMRRRSVRWFTDQEVDRKLIDQALAVARQAPTACNRMPYEFLVYDDPELVPLIAGIPFGTGGYSDNIPVIVVVVGQLSNYFSPRDRHAIYVDSSLASMSFMFALETVGLASCAINWPDFEPLERKMANTLGLDRSERPIMLIAVGHADPVGEVAFSQKKELDTFRHYNRIRTSD